MYDFELTLIGAEGYVKDKNGNHIPQMKKTTVLCDLKSVTRSEFYSAAQAGLNPEQVFEINGFEYSGESEIEFEGERYSVVRTYRPSFEKMELACERKAKHGERFSGAAE